MKITIIKVFFRVAVNKYIPILLLLLLFIIIIIIIIIIMLYSAGTYNIKNEKQ